ncbi:hypothetical protein J6590_009170 [Homalodisca vitripennis]|nr:hypothetical protein J6590_009170 [Homalodisca vitripennis]
MEGEGEGVRLDCGDWWGRGVGTLLDPVRYTRWRAANHNPPALVSAASCTDKRQIDDVYCASRPQPDNANRHIIPVTIVLLWKEMWYSPTLKVLRVKKAGISARLSCASLVNVNKDSREPDSVRLGLLNSLNICTAWRGGRVGDSVVEGVNAVGRELRK